MSKSQLRSLVSILALLASQYSSAAYFRFTVPSESIYFTDGESSPFSVDFQMGIYIRNALEESADNSFESVSVPINFNTPFITPWFNDAQDRVVWSQRKIGDNHYQYIIGMGSMRKTAANELIGPVVGGVAEGYNDLSVSPADFQFAVSVYNGSVLYSNNPVAFSFKYTEHTPEGRPYERFGRAAMYGLGAFQGANLSYAQALEYEGLTAPVPVPAAVWLFGSSLLGLLRFRRGRQKRVKAHRLA